MSKEQNDQSDDILDFSGVVWKCFRNYKRDLKKNRRRRSFKEKHWMHVC